VGLHSAADAAYARAAVNDAARDRMLAALCAAIAAALVLTDLGDPALWQDEAQTALLAQSVLEFGVPLGFDGRNHASQELGKEYAGSGAWLWHTWLSFYLTAASFASFGQTTFAARLPFALCGVASAALCYGVARRWWRDRAAALAAGLTCALSVPFLILSRQCRYYSLAALCCLVGLDAYARLDEGRTRTRVALFLAALAAFHTHYIYAGTLMASLWLHALVFARRRVPALAALSALLLLATSPWLVAFAGVRPGGDAYLASVIAVGKLLGYTRGYAGLVFENFLPPWLLLAPLVVLAWRLRRRLPPLAIDPQTRTALSLLACYVGASLVLVSALSPLLYYRYLAPLAPALFLLQGLLFGRLWRASRVAAALAAALWLYGSQLDRWATELREDMHGPVSGLAAFFQTHARAGDVLAISYEDLPLKFYTSMRVLGGLTGEDLSDAARADWIVVRHHGNTHADKAVRRRLLALLRANPQAYARHELDAPDTPFENREEPRLHRYRTATSPRFPRVVVFERLR
jgi:hypothetical protein